MVGYLGRLNINGATGLILGDEPMMTTWRAESGKREGILLRWVAADREETLLKAVDEVSGAWAQDFEVSWTSGELTLFDSACEGTRLDDFLLIEVVPGRYRISSSIYKDSNGTEFIMHKMSLLAG